MAHGDKHLRTSLTVSRTIAVVASALGLCTACFYIPSRPAQPPPPDLVTLSADTLFFSAAVGQSSTPQQFSIANSSSLPVSINPQSQWVVGEPKYPAFSIQTDCGPSLAPRSTCVVTVIFSPTPQTINTHAILRFKFHGTEAHFVSLKGQLVQPATSAPH